VSTIVAIGGGEIADAETEAIDEAILAATGTDDPTVLFVPTASGDAEEYCETFADYYGEQLGATVDTLRLVTGSPSAETVAAKIANADAVYVGGGDTGFMLDTWRTRGVVESLRRAWRDDTVLAGLSAGALCWASGGLSDAVALEDVTYGPVTGTGFLDGLHLTVHADPERRTAFADYLVERGVPGVALEDEAALEVTDGEWRLRTSSPNAFAYLLSPTGDTYEVEPLPDDGSYRPLDTLR
jgi:dipeptidase E